MVTPAAASNRLYSSSGSGADPQNASPDDWKKWNSPNHGGVGDGEIGEDLAVDLDAGERGDVRETAIALVAVKVAVGAHELHWRSIGAPQAGETKIDLQIDAGRPFHVIDHEQVQIPIPIQVSGIDGLNSINCGGSKEERREG